MVISSETSLRPTARLTGIRVAFDGRDVLHGVDLDVRSREIAVIVGPNGAGKSTLLEAVAGTVTPRSGTRALEGAVAFVPQRTVISPRLPLTVRDVVRVGAWGRSRAWRRLDASSHALVAESMDRLGILTLSASPFSALSGGQQQRALLAQGLARGADLLLLDEPTTGLDAESGRRIRSVLREESERGVAVVCVSHDEALIADAHRIIRLEEGTIVGTTASR